MIAEVDWKSNRFGITPDHDRISPISPEVLVSKSRDDRA